MQVWSQASQLIVLLPSLSCPLPQPCWAPDLGMRAVASLLQHLDCHSSLLAWPGCRQLHLLVICHLRPDSWWWHAGVRARLQSSGWMGAQDPDSDEEFWEQARAQPPLAAAQEAALSDLQRSIVSICLSPRWGHSQVIHPPPAHC